MKAFFWMIFFLIGFATASNAQYRKLESAFASIQKKNFGFAIESFQKGKAKNFSLAAYGFAQIYGNSVEFNQIDSAIFYTKIAIDHFEINYRKLPSRFKERFVKLGWEYAQLWDFLQAIYEKKTEQLARTSDIDALNSFLEEPLADHLKEKVSDWRDSLWYNGCPVSSYDCRRNLMLTTCNSQLKYQLHKEIEAIEYHTWVSNELEEELATYIVYHPNSEWKRAAEDKLYSQFISTNDTSEFKRFIKNYPNSIHIHKIWRAFYELSSGNYEASKMAEFIKRYPDYPFADDVEAELALMGKSLFPYSNAEGLYGFMDERGETIIEAAYEWAGEFKEGLSVVMQSGLYGIIDKQGNTHIPFQYSFIDDFYNGLAIVERNGFYGIINRAGTEIIPPDSFEDLRWVFDNHLAFVDGHGIGLLSNEGERIAHYDYSSINPLNELYALVEKDGKVGVVNADFQEVIPAEFDQLLQSGNYFIAQKNGKKGIIDFSGKQMLPIEYDEIGEPFGGFSIIRKGSMFTHVNQKTWQIRNQWSEVFPNYLNVSALIDAQFVILKKKKFYVCDTLKHAPKLIPLKNLIFVSNVYVGNKEIDGLFGFMDRNGKELLTFEFESVERLKNGQFMVKKLGKVGVVSQEGKLIIPCEYQDVNLFDQNKFYLVEKDGKFGILAQNGSEILDPSFDFIKVFNEETWLVKEGSNLKYYFPRLATWIAPKISSNDE